MPITTTRSRAEAARRRERRTLGILFGVCALLVIGGAALLWTVTAPDGGAGPIGGPFRLQASDGRSVTDRDLRGKYLLIYFGYTICPDVCPTTLQTVVQALGALGAKADRLQPVLITVDPARDTPAVLAQYTAAFSPRLLGLSGTPREIAQVEREYHIYAAIHRTGPKPGEYTVDHSSVLYLMGPDGNFVARLPADAGAADLAASLDKRLS